jgi:putative transposase
MNDIESLSHTKWECKYHIVFIPKCRRRVLLRYLTKTVGERFAGVGWAQAVSG